MLNPANVAFRGVHKLTWWAVDPSNATAPFTPSNARKGISEVLSEGGFLVMLVGFVAGVIHTFLAPSIHKRLTTHEDAIHHTELLAIFGNNTLTTLWSSLTPGSIWPRPTSTAPGRPH